MSSTEEDDTLAALAQYRWCIAQHNREIFAKIVKMAEDFEPENPHTPEQLNSRRNEERRGAGASPSRVQGGHHERCDDNELVAGLEFPEDFWLLMGQVDTLHGHGWPNYRAPEWKQQQPIFWSGIECSELGAKNSLVYPDELPLSGWEVPGGWECGYGRENTTCYVLYCRREDGLPCGKESDTNWHWRYVVNMNQYGEEFFDDVMERLAWYEECNVPDLENLSNHTDDWFDDY
ncbi:hypothetical protein PG984_008873 [Apiospora sp. TS-2023a]